MLFFHLSLLLFLFAGISGCELETTNAGRVASQSLSRPEPFRLKQQLPPVQLEGFKEVQEIGRAFWPASKSSIGRILHAIHAFHKWPGGPEPGKPALEEMVRVMLDYRVANQWYGGRFPILKTEYGLRFATPTEVDNAGQSHFDQVIAELAILGIGANEPVIVPDGKFRIEDFVTDTIANLSLDGEFEWSALTIVLYRSSEREWTNRFGTRFTIDDLVHALIVRRFSASSCLGTHTLFTLAAIRQIDEENQTLSTQTRNTLNRYLQRTSAFVASLQMPDGAFDPRWWMSLEVQPWYIEIRKTIKPEDAASEFTERVNSVRRKSATVNLSGKTLSTSHHIEWLLLLPPAWQPPASVFERASSFLRHSLVIATPAERERDYCQYSHAISVLVLLRRREVADDVQSQPSG